MASVMRGRNFPFSPSLSLRCDIEGYLLRSFLWSGFGVASISVRTARRSSIDPVRIDPSLRSGWLGRWDDSREEILFYHTLNLPASYHAFQYGLDLVSHSRRDL